MILVQIYRIYYKRARNIGVLVDCLAERFPTAGKHALYATQYQELRRKVLYYEPRIKSTFTRYANDAKRRRERCYSLPPVAMRVEMRKGAEMLTGDPEAEYYYSPFGNYASTASDYAPVLDTPRDEKMLQNWGYTNRWSLTQRGPRCGRMYLLHNDQMVDNDYPIIITEVRHNEYRSPEHQPRFYRPDCTGVR